MIFSEPAELDPAIYGLNNGSEQYKVEGIVDMGKENATLSEIVERLEEAYCGPITAEFRHLIVSISPFAFS